MGPLGPVSSSLSVHVHCLNEGAGKWGTGTRGGVHTLTLFCLGPGTGEIFGGLGRCRAEHPRARQHTQVGYKTLRPGEGMSAEGEAPRPRIRAQTLFIIINPWPSSSANTIHHNDLADALSSEPSALSSLITARDFRPCHLPPKPQTCPLPHTHRHRSVITVPGLRSTLAPPGTRSRWGSVVRDVSTALTNTWIVCPAPFLCPRSRVPAPINRPT